jgi:hypothetical protein
MAWGVLKIIIGLGTFAFGFYFGFMDVWRGVVGGWLLGSGIYDLYYQNKLKNIGDDISQQQQKKSLKIRLFIDLIVLGLMIGHAIGHQIWTGRIRAKQKAAYTQMKTIQTALYEFVMVVGRFPTTDEGLKVLINNVSGIPGWNGPFLGKKEILLDP